jgi:hypothetical protein
MVLSINKTVSHNKYCIQQRIAGFGLYNGHHLILFLNTKKNIYRLIRGTYAFAAVYLYSSVFWDLTQLRLVKNRRFGTNYAA